MFVHDVKQFPPRMCFHGFLWFITRSPSQFCALVSLQISLNVLDSFKSVPIACWEVASATTDNGNSVECKSSLLSHPRMWFITFYSEPVVSWRLSFCSVAELRLANLTWLILPVVICLSQRLSHACLSISIIQRNCEWLIKTVIVYLIIEFTWITVVILELIHAGVPDFCGRAVFIR